jgi:hypothetical protein
MTATGNVYGDWFVGNVDSATIFATGNITGGNILTGGEISAGGSLTAANITGNNFSSTGIISATGNITGNNVIVGNILIPSSGNVTLGNVNINNLAEPVANSDAATKFYVDSVAANVLPIITNQTINPDGNSAIFSLDQSTTAVGILVTINGVTQTPNVAYTVTGNSITITETPLITDVIQVRYLSGTTTGGGGTNYANANAVAYGESGWAGNLIPSGNLVYNLGNSTNRWNDLYLSGNTIYLDSATIGANGNDITFSGNVTSNSVSTGGSVSATGNVTGGNIRTAGAVSATGSMFSSTITLSGTGTAVNASSGNILTNKVTGTQFAFLNGLYTATLTGGGATSDYTLALPANAGANGQVLTTDGGGNLSWTTAAGSYGNSNVATFLASYGSNTISTTGNITAGNLIGNISITGNVTGTSPNVTLVAGNYSYVFDNTGILTLPTGSSGNEGGEIAFTQAANSTLAGNTVVVDQYADKIRIFESGGTNRGVYVDLTKAPAGVGGELSYKASGLVNRGVDVTLDNLKARVAATGNVSLQLSTVTGTYSIFGSDTRVQNSVSGTTITGQTPITVSTTPAYLDATVNFTVAGATDTWIIMDTANAISWRISLIIGSDYLNNMITIERLV